MLFFTHHYIDFSLVCLYRQSSQSSLRVNPNYAQRGFKGDSPCKWHAIMRNLPTLQSSNAISLWRCPPSELLQNFSADRIVSRSLSLNARFRFHRLHPRPPSNQRRTKERTRKVIALYSVRICSRIARTIAGKGKYLQSHTSECRAIYAILQAIYMNH